MRIKILTADGVAEEVKSVHLAFIRGQVAEWIKSPDHGEISEWPAILDTLATIAADTPDGVKFPPHVKGAIEAMSEEAVATLAALTGMMGAQFGMTAESMVAMHHLEGDAVTGTAIAGFMLGRHPSGAETHILAHLLRTLDIEQRVSLVCMTVAFLCVSGFTADDIRKFEYPSTVDTSTVNAHGTLPNCHCDYCEEVRARNAAPETD